MRIFLFVFILLSSLFPLSSFAYPGCANGDIIIGGQVWASCNALTKGKGSDQKTGWFLAGDKFATFISYSDIASRLEFQKKQTQKDATFGPCARGYRIPNRSEWETALYYARLNSTDVASLLSLPYNGGYRVFHDTDGDITVEEREDILGAYWSSTSENIWGSRPVVLHLGSVSRGSRYDGTDGVYQEENSRYQYSEQGLGLVRGEDTEMANVRCIRR